MGTARRRTLPRTKRRTAVSVRRHSCLLQSFDNLYFALVAPIGRRMPRGVLTFPLVVAAPSCVEQACVRRVSCRSFMRSGATGCNPCVYAASWLTPPSTLPPCCVLVVSQARRGWTLLPVPQPPGNPSSAQDRACVSGHWVFATVFKASPATRANEVGSLRLGVLHGRPACCSSFDVTLHPGRGLQRCAPMTAVATAAVYPSPKWEQKPMQSPCWARSPTCMEAQRFVLHSSRAYSLECGSPHCLSPAHALTLSPGVNHVGFTPHLRLRMRLVVAGRLPSGPDAGAGVVRPGLQSTYVFAAACGNSLCHTAEGWHCCMAKVNVSRPLVQAGVLAATTRRR
jgi:hypothetical protein